jgi:ribosome-binding factor A
MPRPGNRNSGPSEPRPAGPSNRMARVEENLRRGIADVLLIGGLRDPRLQGVNFTVTDVKVDPDLTLARVFVDILDEAADAEAVLAGLRAAAAAVRHELRGKLQLRKLPTLRFERDQGIERGLKVERILAEIREQAPRPSEPEQASRPSGPEQDAEPKPG